MCVVVLVSNDLFMSLQSLHNPPPDANGQGHSRALLIALSPTTSVHILIAITQKDGGVFWGGDSGPCAPVSFQGGPKGAPSCFGGRRALPRASTVNNSHDPLPPPLTSDIVNALGSLAFTIKIKPMYQWLANFNVGL